MSNQPGPYTLARLLNGVTATTADLNAIPSPYDDIITAVLQRQDCSPGQAFEAVLAKYPGFLAGKVRADLASIDLSRPCEAPAPRGMTARDLLHADFPPLQWLVDGLIIRPGLTLLGGAPKVGKSWLSLQIARAVALGHSLLDRPVTAPGRVLYYALEDGPARLQSRLKRVGWTGDEDVLFLFGDALPPLDLDGLDVLESDIRAARPALVVCDSFAAAKSARLDENDGGQVAELMYSLSRLTAAHNLALLVVHHHRKMATGSPLADLRGSGALGGAADGILALYRERGEPECKLGLDSRDAEGADWTLSFNGSIWTLLGGAAIGEYKRAERKVTQALRALGPDGGTIDQVIEAAGGMRRQDAIRALKDMIAAGSVELSETPTDGKGPRARATYRYADLPEAD